MNLLKILRKRPERSTRKAVYTFIFGDYDELKPPAIVTPGWDYVCFTDDAALRSEIWDVRLSRRQPKDRDLNDKRFAMRHMILAHQYLRDHDLSLSIGGQVELNCNLDDLIHQHLPLEDDIMICRHNERACVYDEAEVCKDLALDDPERIKAHMQRYRAAGYPVNSGLYISGVIGRRHHRSSVRAMSELWWHEYRQGSWRDQLSLNYAIWKSSSRISALDYDEQFVVKRNFIVHPHKGNFNFGRADIKFLASTSEHTAPPCSSRSDYVGHVDMANSYRIFGWAADRNRLNTSIYVSLYDGETVIATAHADLSRPDIAAHLRDNGFHGFAMPVPASLKDGSPHQISVKFEDADIQLAIS